MKADARTRQLAQIHLGKKQLGLDDETYRALLQSVGGKRSAAEMDLAQRSAVIAHMMSRGARLGFTGRAGRNMSPLERKIRALWWHAHQAGVIRDASDRALRAWVKRQTGSADVAWLDKSAAAKCVEALKGMAARVNRRREDAETVSKCVDGGDCGAGGYCDSCSAAGEGRT